MRAPTAPRQFDQFEAVPRPVPIDVHAADVACYPQAYEVTLTKVEALCERFAQGVTLYRGRSLGRWYPVGYSAWHPFDPALLDRPWPENVPIDPDAAAAYLFNYSVIPSLIGSPLARDLMRHLDAQVRGFTVLAADTVSPDGVRAARRWGMQLHEARRVRGAPWELWARRAPR